MKPTTAIIITSINDTNLTINYDSKDKIALDYSIILNSTENSIEYFFRNNPLELSNIPALIAKSWYRNSDNIDNHNNKYSIGLVLEKRICYMISNIIKFYYSFLYLTKKYKKIEIPKNHPSILNEVINIFKEQIILIDPQEYSLDLSISIEKRCLIKKVKINKLSKYFRFIQKPFIQLLKNKTMIFPDWTYSHQKNNNYLYQNKLNIFNSFYYKETYNPINKNQTPVINIDAMRDILSEAKTNDIDSNNLITLIIKIIHEEYRSSINAIEHQYNTMSELINYYKPTKVIVPDDAQYPWFNMLMQITARLKIETITVVDGYPMYLDIDHVKIKEDGINTLVDTYATMGTLNHDMHGKAYPGFKRLLICPPILSHLTNIKKQKTKYDFLIMMPMPNLLNPDSRWDMRYKYIIDIINCLILKGRPRIAIKIKPGTDLSDTGFLKKYFIKNNLNDIDFLKGKGAQAISRSKNIIGQLSTSTYESLIIGKPYYIYEPLDCALANFTISNSIVDRCYIARRIEDLSANILNKNNVNIATEKLVDGPKMSERII